MRNLLNTVVIVGVAAALQDTSSATEWSQYWPQWRGPAARGISATATPPLEWNETKNVRWKAPIPGSGTSTPIIWEDKVFLLTAIKSAPASAAAAGSGAEGGARSEVVTDSYRFVVLCLDRKSGKTLWEKTACETVPHEGHHRDHGYASASPVTDGQHVLAYFGSRGLYCYDMQGNLKWSKDFGDMRTRNEFGEGSSPALHGNTVVVTWDDESDNDFVVALNKETGEQLWKKPRAEATSWATPLIVEHGGKTQVIVNATAKVRSYDLKTGEELWNIGGQTANVIPSPVSDKDLVIAMSGFRGAAIRAIKLGATGELDSTDAVVWQHNKSTPYVPSPLLVDNLLYFISGNNGMLSCFDALKGTAHYEAERLEGVMGVYASPVASAGHVYVLGRDGTCLVLKQGPKLEIVSRNKVDEKSDASLALVGKEIFLRGHQNLYCIAAD